MGPCVVFGLVVTVGRVVGVSVGVAEGAIVTDSSTCGAARLLAVALVTVGAPACAEPGSLAAGADR